jgi:hypothetical protein
MIDINIRIIVYTLPLYWNWHVLTNWVLLFELNKWRLKLTTFGPKKQKASATKSSEQKEKRRSKAWREHVCTNPRIPASSYPPSSHVIKDRFFWCTFQPLELDSSEVTFGLLSLFSPESHGQSTHTSISAQSMVSLFDLWRNSWKWS